MIVFGEAIKDLIETIADMRAHGMICRFRIAAAQRLSQRRMKLFWLRVPLRSRIVEPVEDEHLLLFNCTA